MAASFVRLDKGGRGSDMGGMAARTPPDSAARLLPPPGERSLDRLRAAAEACDACPLHLTGTQTVFGEGPPDAVVMLVGEQPGDAEDIAGHPFVGPAGKLLDRGLEEAGIERRRVYVTNVVKHFKWVPRGKRRIHAKPASMEIQACRPWLGAEIEAVGPEVIVALGATAAKALIGPGFKVSEERGRLVESPLAPFVTATVHPSSVLRAPDDETRRAERARLVDDLRRVAEVLRQRPRRD